MIFFRRVVGESMRPTLRPGQVVWAHEMRNFRKGQVVIAFVGDKEVVKRIESIENGVVTLVGDNENQSTNYKVSDTKIEGTVFFPWVAK